MMVSVLLAALLMMGAQEEGAPVAVAVDAPASDPVSGSVVFEDEEGAAEGDEAAEADMAGPSVSVGAVITTATQPVSIDAYSRHYEPPKSDEEARYEAGIENGKRNRQNQLQTLEGAWQVYDAANTPLIHFIFRTTGTGSGRRIEGAWRREGAGAGVESSGFVESVIEVGPQLEIIYFPSKTAAPDILHLRRAADGVWRGTLMTPDAEAAVVTLTPSS